jgi:hypothetical protein
VEMQGHTCCSRIWTGPLERDQAGAYENWPCPKEASSRVIDGEG